MLSYRFFRFLFWLGLCIAVTFASLVACLHALGCQVAGPEVAASGAWWWHPTAFGMHQSTPPRLGADELKILAWVAKLVSIFFLAAGGVKAFRDLNSQTVSPLETLLYWLFLSLCLVVILSIFGHLRDQLHPYKLEYACRTAAVEAAHKASVTFHVFGFTSAFLFKEYLFEFAVSLSPIWLLAIINLTLHYWSHWEAASAPPNQRHLYREKAEQHLKFLAFASGPITLASLLFGLLYLGGSGLMGKNKELFAGFFSGATLFLVFVAFTLDRAVEASEAPPGWVARLWQRTHAAARLCWLPSGRRARIIRIAQRAMPS